MDKTVADQYFGEIYEITYKELSIYVISRIKNIDDAKDLLQITYTAFYKRLQKKGVIPTEAVIGYLKTIARHELGRHFGYFKKRQKDIFLDDESIPQFLIEDNVSDSFEDSVLDKIVLERIWEYIRQKGGLTYRIFVLRYTFDLTLEETAKTLDVPLYSVTNCIYRTIKELRDVYSVENSILVKNVEKNIKLGKESIIE